MDAKVITITGPTATGKTAVAAHLAHLLGSSILSADSRQVYRGMDIGTGKDLSDYVVAGETVPYYLIDICDPGERYNLHRYLTDAHAVLERLPDSPPNILCGGTGLYVESLVKGYRLSTAPEDPQLRAELDSLSLTELQSRAKGLSVEDPENPRRLIRAIEVDTYFKKQGRVPEYITHPPLEGPIFCLDVPREVRRDRISRRLRLRLEQGMIEEVEALLEQVTPEQLIYYGLEYKYVTEYVIGKRSYDDMVHNLETAIHQFAKRQMTWFRGMERRGLSLTYIRPLDTPDATAEHLFQLL